MKRLPLKAIISSLLLLIILFLALSGSLLHFNKTGVVLGIPRYTLRNAHTVAAVIMCLLTIVHIVLNRRLYFGELRALFKRKPDSR